MAEEKGGSGGEVSGGPSLDWSGFSPPSGGGSGGESGGKDWGGPITSKKSALEIIKSIESHPVFLDKKDEFPHWERQKVLRQRDDAYRVAYPEGSEPTQGMGYELKKQGITPETLQKEIEKYELRDFEDDRSRNLRELEARAGGPELAKEKLSKGRSLVKEIDSPKLNDLLDHSGAGNDARVILKAAELYDLLQEIKESKKRRKR
jgi:hypothetical protein